MRANRSIKQLGDLLSRAGFDVLRFDYFGTGDSFGDGLGSSLAEWLEDAEYAVEELMGTAGIRRVAIVGLRLGAYVAASTASALRGRIERVVLWDPVVDGGAYLDELLARNDADPASPFAEVGGYPLPATFQEQLRGVDLTALRLGRTPVLMACSAEVTQIDADAVDWEALSFERRASPGCWTEERDFGAGAVPVELLQAVTSWLE
jgi:pimeloyl-ACP methyl ester carboxylesterase